MPVVPLILAIDGSGDGFSAAVNRGTAVHSKHCADQPQATVALPLIRQLLNEQNLALADCDAFAFAAGPGKFSTLRLICALATSFAYAGGKPLLAVPGFAALAEDNFGTHTGTVKCALPAHQQHIYFATCRRQRGCWRVLRTAVLPCAGKVPGARIRHACGAGYQRYPHLLGTAAFCDNAPHSRAAAVWRVAQAMLHRNEVSDPLNCQPLYLRRQVAQTIKQRQCRQTSSKN